LVETLKKRLTSNFGIDFTNNELVIVSGATQACDILSKIFLQDGDTVITEAPSYGSYFNIFRSYGANLAGVAVDENGMDFNSLEELLKSDPNVKVIYTIPTFQNPTGFTAGLEARKSLYEMARRYDVLILEDDPYSELRYAGAAVPAIKTMDRDGRVFYVGSLSKVMMPSVRIGYIVCDKAYVPLINVAKQITDVHSNSLGQYVAERYMNTCGYDAHIAHCCEIYRRKSGLMQTRLKERMHPSVRVSSPEGGLFMMMFLPERCDSMQFARSALDRGVACVPGSAFMIDQQVQTNMIRLCYSFSTVDEIEKGVDILGRLSFELF